MLFYDVECFKYYWCIVVIDEENSTRHVFEDIDSLRDFYKANRTKTWVGYNSRQYDMPMTKFIMLGLNPYECSHGLINMGLKWFQFGYEITQLYKRIPFKNFDCILLNKGLKKLEAFRGSSIIECKIPWDIDRPLTREEKDEVIEYCTHDVLETREVFYDTKQEYDAHESLVSAFDLDPSHFIKTKAQLSALILNAVQQPRFDEWEFEIADTLELGKYKWIEDWYRNRSNHDYQSSLHCDVAGVPHVFAWGGIHGALPKYSGEGRFINMDVASYYPAMMIEYGFLSRNVLDPKKYTQIRDERLVFKANKDPRQLPYKIVLNGTYGAMKDKYNALYDPRQANSVCVTGQLLLLDLIEKLEPYCQIIQSNTDGVLVKLHEGTDEEYNMVRSIGEKWSARTRMELEYEEVIRVFQKDVNNYVTLDSKGKWKSKGAYLKTWLREDENKNLVDDYTDFDLPIVREALINQLLFDKPIEDTINECQELLRFQKVIMVSGKYKHAIHGKPVEVKFKEEYTGKTKKRLELTDECSVLPEKHLRVFASTDEKHGGVYKVHKEKGNLNKVGDTPTHAFLANGDITESNINDYPLDRQYYIDMAKNRLKKIVG